MGPLGPAPNRMILKPPETILSCSIPIMYVFQRQVPKMKPIIKPTAGVQGFEVSAGIPVVASSARLRTSPHHGAHFPCDQLSAFVVRHEGTCELSHLSKVEGPCIRPPPVVLDGMGGILKGFFLVGGGGDKNSL